MTQQRAPTIAVFTKNRTNPAYTAARLGAERTAARLGATVTHYVPDRPDDLSEQIALVERAISDRPDAMVFVPVHATAMNESVRRINAAGIPLVNYLNRLQGGNRVTYVGSDDCRLAHDIAMHLFRHLGNSGNVAILEGVPDAVTSMDRMRGFRNALRESPGMRLAGSRPGYYQRAAAGKAMDELLASTRSIDGVLAANDEMALGAIDTLRRSGRRVPVVGVNAIPEAIAALKSGALLATADFDAMKIASIATEAALRHLRGQPVPPEIELPVSIVDVSNCQPWDRPLEDRECPRWEDVVGTGPRTGNDKRG